MHHTEIESTEELRLHIRSGRSLDGCVFQGLDLTTFEVELKASSLRNAVFLGCQLSAGTWEHAVHQGAVLFPDLPNLPFKAHRGQLYTPGELMGGYRMGHPGSFSSTLDGQAYTHFMEMGGAQPHSMLEALAQRLHDHAITDAMEEFLQGKRVAAIMGGHAMKRGSEDYRQVADIARQLTQKGFLLATGGGPGAMEATHLGASFARKTTEDLNEAITMLAAAPLYNDAGWLDTAFEVRTRFQLIEGEDWPCSLGIPTWHYGHEPPTIFASHIAKYFANSVREEGLLAIATAGVIFSPGSAGTIQEIFQDATQNHYKSFKVCSPMILLGEDFWRVRKPVFPLLAQLAAGHDYGRHLHITDSTERVVKLLIEFAANP